MKRLFILSLFSILLVSCVHHVSEHVCYIKVTEVESKEKGYWYGAGPHDPGFPFKYKVTLNAVSGETILYTDSVYVVGDTLR